jgi:methylglutaconyl-CoA hydratase
VALLTLERPELSNAFDGALVDEFSKHLEHLAQDHNCRVLVVQGRGKNFCAGADLTWMKEQGDLSLTKNREGAVIISQLFHQLASLPFPTLGVAHGAVFGGGVGLIACCDMAVASDQARFCLSEVKVGILPAVILPYLQRKITPGQLRRLALSGAVFTASEALTYGLVERCCPDEELQDEVTTLVNQLLAAAPEAQRRLKRLLDHDDHQRVQARHEELCNAIAEARTGAEGQAGLAAFLQKRNPPWTVTLAAEWNS